MNVGKSFSGSRPRRTAPGRQGTAQIYLTSERPRIRPPVLFLFSNFLENSNDDVRHVGCRTKPPFIYIRAIPGHSEVRFGAARYDNCGCEVAVGHDNRAIHLDI